MIDPENTLTESDTDAVIAALRQDAADEAAETPCDCDEPGCVECEDRHAQDDEPHDGFMSDADADGDALASAGWGTDEDYGGGDERF